MNEYINFLNLADIFSFLEFGSTDSPDEAK